MNDVNEVHDVNLVWQETGYTGAGSVVAIIDTGIDSDHVGLDDIDDSNYTNMSDDFERSLAFKTASDLIFKGKEQPSGYTEPLLHINRIKKKSIPN